MPSAVARKKHVLQAQLGAPASEVNTKASAKPLRIAVSMATAAKPA
jgi:hypothetical protein